VLEFLKILVEENSAGAEAWILLTGRKKKKVQRQIGRVNNCE
jgi:hypothetical protein